MALFVLVRDVNLCEHKMHHCYVLLTKMVPLYIMEDKNKFIKNIKYGEFALY